MIRCALSGRELGPGAAVPVGSLRPWLLGLIGAEHPGLAADAVIDRVEIDRYRRQHFESLLAAEQAEIAGLTRQIAAGDAAARPPEPDPPRSLGERLADQIAAFGGSWAFILSFGAFLAAWMSVNLLLAAGAVDPFPFILLNLMLSALAALQAPVIMMSQNRQEAKDRARASSDYQVNLRSELEIRQLHEKLDHLLIRQWARLAEIQQLQIELLEEARRG